MFIFDIIMIDTITTKETDGNMSYISQKELVQSFSEFYEQYYKKLLATCYARNFQPFAEDVTHEALTRLWQKWEERSHCPTAQNFSWLVTTAGHCYQELNKKMPSKQMESIQQKPLFQSQLRSDPIRHVDEKFNYEDLLKDIQSILSADEYRIFEYSVFRNMTSNQISKELHIPAGTVRSLLSRTKKKLREKL